jgi:crotonobetainyl-CoA:carnitine CoA-transferase CaiB-like acyl-CoA transferase
MNERVHAVQRNFFADLCVLDHSRYLTGGLASQMLADFGCEVIKVEELRHGDFCREEFPYKNGVGSHFVAIGRNKKSITLNLKSAAGKQAYLKLAEAADIVLDNYRPGMLNRLGIGYEAVRTLNPGIIHCSITGFGKDDPRSLKAAHDANFQARVGFQDINHARITPLHLCDLATANVAAQAILAALCQRTLTGEGSYCDVRMSDSFTWWQSLLYQRWQFNGNSQTADDIEYPSVGYNYLKTKDGRWFSIAMVEKKFWEGFCRDIGCEELIEDHLKRCWEAPQAFNAIEALFKTKTYSEWDTWFSTRDLCAHPVLTISEAIDCHMAESNGQIAYCDFPDTGKTLQVKTPHYVSSIPVDLAEATAPPRLGEHTYALLDRLGYSDTEILDMVERGDCGSLNPPIAPDHLVGKQGFDRR